MKKVQLLNQKKMLTRKPYKIAKIGSRITSIITVAGLGVTRKFSEIRDQKFLHSEVDAELSEPSNIFEGNMGTSENTTKEDNYNQR